MITVKQFAEERGITIQAVHQSIKRKKKKELLEGHVIEIDGIKYLDDVAVAILDESRSRVSVVVQREDTDERIRQLEEENRNLLIKVAAQADKIAQLSEWKSDNALLIANAEVNQKALIEATEHYQEEISTLEKNMKFLNEYAEKADNENMALEAEKAELKRMLELEKNKTWIDKLKEKFR